MGLLDDILASYNAGYPSPLNNPSPTGIAYPGQFNLPGFLNSPDFGAGAQPFMPAPAGPPPAAPPAAPRPPIPQPELSARDAVRTFYGNNANTPDFPAPPVPAPTAPQSVTYPSPVQSGTTDDFRRALASGGETGLAPGQSSPFPDVASAAGPPAAPAFGAGAAPFSFGGPGSMNVQPSQLASAEPVPLPRARPVAADAPPAVAAASPTDVSSVNRGATYAAGPVAPGAVNVPPAAVSAPPAAAAPAPFSLGGAGDRLSLATKGFVGNLHNGPLGAIAAGLGSLITGAPSDAGSIATQQGNATARALLAKGASVEDVQAAVHNPVLMKSLIDSYYGKDKFKVVQTGENDNGKAFSIFNETDGTMKPIARDATETGGTVMGPGGKPIVIPPGVNRKEFIKRVSETAADAASGKMTEAQAKASSYASRMEKAQADLATLQNEGLSATQAVTSSLPGVGNYLQTDNHQRFETAKSAFITALLRQESGAAINKSEFSRYEKELFPQPGDSPQTVSQKAQLRSGALEQMRRAAGPGYQSAPAPAANGLPSGWSVQVH